MQKNETLLSFDTKIYISFLIYSNETSEGSEFGFNVSFRNKKNSRVLKVISRNKSD